MSRSGLGPEVSSVQDGYDPKRSHVSLRKSLVQYPGAIFERWVQMHSEWGQAAFDTLATPLEQTAGTPSREAGGRHLNDEWLGVMLEVGAWLATETGPYKPADVARFIATQFAARVLTEPSRSERYRRAKQALGAFRNWQAGVR